MADSILTTTKRTLGLAEDYVVFDPEIIMHINSVLGDLNQLGIGPELGFEITGPDEEWADFLGDVPDTTNPELRYNPVKSYMYLRVRMLWDPPSVGYVLTSWEKQIEKAEWRINVMREDIVHPTPPTPEVVDPEELLFEGG